jgi:hypothetical protein
MREAKLVGWFFLLVGVSVLLFSAWGAITAAPPAPTNSLIQRGMARALAVTLGPSAGTVVYHLVWGVLGGFVAWVALKILNYRRS